MSLKLWCPDCNTQTIVDMMSVYDGYEFACDDCKRVFYVRIERGLTSLAPDVCLGCGAIYNRPESIGCGLCGTPRGVAPAGKA